MVVMLNVSVSSLASWTVLRVSGEIDMATCPQLRQEIVGQISQGNLQLVIDLDAVDFIDSTGLGVLIGGLKRARSQGGDLRVSGVDERLERIFDLTGLRDVLAVVDPTDPDREVGVDQ
jgi:anti-sigma B factor antagonist